MPLSQLPGDNPQGLATFDPMTDEAYRAVARRIADRHARDYGRANAQQNVDEVRPETGSEAVRKGDLHRTV